MSENRKELLAQRLLTAEQGVLGSMLIDEETVGRMLMAVSEEDFQIPENRNIFRAMKELYGQGRACDPILVNEHLGGAYGKLMADLMEVTPTAANAGEYAKALREASRLWRLQTIGEQLTKAENLDICRELADQVNLLLSERSGIRRLDMTRGWKEFFTRHGPKKPRDFIRWGFSELDEYLHVNRGDMVVIGGYPSAGKTAFALQIAFQIAKKKRVGFFSYETSADKLHDRTVACQALASYGKIMSDKLEKSDFRQVYEMRGPLTAPSLELLEADGMTVSGIGSYAMARHYDLIIVDYLQKIHSRQGARQLSAFEEVSQVSSDLQQLGRRTGMVIIALSQLSRPEKKNNGEEKPPSLSSLRQSGQIEQDADVVLLLYKAVSTDPASKRNLDFAKNKDGLSGIGIAMDFDGDNQRFIRARTRPMAEKQPEKKNDAPAQTSIFRPMNESGPTPFDGGKGST